MTKSGKKTWIAPMEVGDEDNGRVIKTYAIGKYSLLEARQESNMAWLFHLDTVENWAYADNVFTPEECDKIKRVALAKGKEAATVVRNNQHNTLDLKVRKNSVVWLSERDQELNWVHDRLANVAISLNEQFFKFNLFGFCENIQFTEYESTGEFYSEHMD